LRRRERDRSGVFAVKVFVVRERALPRWALPVGAPGEHGVIRPGPIFE
jgi:hypothetical protein